MRVGGDIAGARFDLHVQAFKRFELAGLYP